MFSAVPNGLGWVVGVGVSDADDDDDGGGGDDDG